MKIKEIIVCTVLVMCSNTLLAEDVMDHDSPEFRTKILNSARSVRSPIDKYKYYRFAIENWQNDESKKEDLDIACNNLFSTLFMNKKHISKKDLLDGCSEEKHESWYGQVETKYYPIVKWAPIYPSSAENNKIEGWATVIYDVDEKGRPRNIKIHESSNEVFNKAAKRAAKKFRYLPARKNGEFVLSKGVKNKFSFKL